MPLRPPHPKDILNNLRTSYDCTLIGVVMHDAPNISLLEVREMYRLEHEWWRGKTKPQEWKRTPDPASL